MSNRPRLRNAKSEGTAVSARGNYASAIPIYNEEEEAKEDLDGSSMWSRSGPNYFGCSEALDELPIGQYKFGFSDSRGVFLVKQEINTDDLFVMEDTVADDVIESIERFWQSEAKYRELGFLWKRGVMLYGPPGTGKTSTVHLLCRKLEELGGISVFLDHPQIAADGLSLLRQIEPNRPIICILEDIDAMIARWGEASYLSILDGELQIDNVVFVATTNYPEDLDARFKNRPSRFDLVRKVGLPSEKDRTAYLRHKNPRLAAEGNEAELQNWAKRSENFSVAHMKELIISVECLGIPFEEAATRLSNMIKDQNKLNSNGDPHTAGFY